MRRRNRYLPHKPFPVGEALPGIWVLPVVDSIDNVRTVGEMGVDSYCMPRLYPLGRFN
jgi:hypothetical protein